MGKPMNKEDIELIRRLYDMGSTFHQISQKMNISWATVRKYVSEYQNEPLPVLSPKNRAGGCGGAQGSIQPNLVSNPVLPRTRVSSFKVSGELTSCEVTDGLIALDVPKTMESLDEIDRVIRELQDYKTWVEQLGLCRRLRHENSGRNCKGPAMAGNGNGVCVWGKNS